MPDERIAAERLDSAQREWERHDRVLRVLIGGVRTAIKMLEAVVDAVEQHGIRSPKQMQAEREQQGM